MTTTERDTPSAELSIATTRASGWGRFNRYWAGHLVSFVGNYFTILALPLAALRLTGSALVVAGVELAELAATVVLGMSLGRWVDHHDIRATLVGADVARAGLLGGLALWMATGAPPALALLAIAVALGALRAMHDSAESALVPALLSESLIVRANARFAISDGVGQIAGSVIVGLVVAIGIHYAFGFDAVTFAIAAGAAWHVGRVAPVLSSTPVITPTSHQDGASGGTIRSTIALFRTEDRTWRLLAPMAVGNVTSACFLGQFVVFGVRTLHLSGFAIGVTFAAMGLGSLVAGAVLDRLAIAPPRLAVIDALIVGAVPIAAAVTRSWPVTLVGFTLVGATMAADMTVLGAMQHRGFGAEVQGRVAMMRRVVLYSLLTPGILVAGFVADRWGPDTTYVSFGIIGLASAVLAVAVGVHRMTEAAAVADAAPGVGRSPAIAPSVHSAA